MSQATARSERGRRQELGTRTAYFAEAHYPAIRSVVAEFAERYPSRMRTASTAERPRQRLSGDERRRQLVDACGYLIATVGYSNTSIRTIAAQANISTGTLLHHFATKESLLVSTLVAVSEDFHDHARAAAQRHSTPKRKLNAMIEAVLESPRHDIGWRVWIAFWHEASLNPSLSQVAVERNEGWEGMLASVIEEGCRQDQFALCDSAEAASELAALINGVAVQRYTESVRWSTARAIAVAKRLVGDWTT
jgi:AcrR family transcriptional regulator